MEFTEKSRLRQAVLQRRDAIAVMEQHRRSQALCQRVAGLHWWAQARVVMATAAMGSEPATGELLEATLAQGKILVLPRVQRGEKCLELYEVRDLALDLQPGVWGIHEPNPARCPRISLAQLDFILVPGVAFDATCARLGYGAGYYDRMLARKECNAHTVAMAFEEQLVAQVPMSAHDQRVELLLTDAGQFGNLSGISG